MPSAYYFAGYYGLRQDSSPEFVAGYASIMRHDSQPRDELGRFARIAGKAKQAGVARGKAAKSGDRLSVAKEMIQGSRDPQGAFEALTELSNKDLRKWRDEALAEAEYIESNPDEADEGTTPDDLKEVANQYASLIELRSWLRGNGGNLSEAEADDLASWMYEEKLDSADPFTRGYRAIMRLDAVRSSCMECVEKHMGAALVLMGEAEAGYPEHKLLAIGHLHEAAEESAELRPQLSVLIRDIRKAYQRGEAIEFETIIDALDQHGVWRFDRKGEGVACGRGWISRRKKCGKDKARTTDPENKAKTVEKQKARQQLRQQVRNAKGQKPYVKPKSEPAPKPKEDEKQDPASKKHPLHAKHMISTDKRITPEKLEAALDAIDSPGAQERIALVRQIINNQGIQAVFNDTGSRVKNKTKVIIDQLDDIGYAGYVKKKVASLKSSRDAVIEATVKRYRETADRYGRDFTADDEKKARQRATKAVDGAIAKLEKGLVANRGSAGGYTRKEDSFVTIKTNSKEKPVGQRIMSRAPDGSIAVKENPNPYYWEEFAIAPGDASKVVQRAIQQHIVDQPDFLTVSNLAGASNQMNTLHTYLHEIGHQIRWAGGAPRPPEGAKKLSRYSRSNADEFFAEHFTAWVLDAEAYRAYDPIGADFIEKHVRAAAEAPKRVGEYQRGRRF